MNNKTIIIGQVIFLVVVLTTIYFAYPKTSVDIEEDYVDFKTINANVIIISENPDFSNPRYLDVGESKNLSFRLKPGTYYWKAGNNLIRGLRKKFTIESEVGMKIERKDRDEEENESELVNIGNVKINITKTEEGVMVGYIILEPNESEKIEDKPDEKYTGRQEE